MNYCDYDVNDSPESTRVIECGKPATAFYVITPTATRTTPVELVARCKDHQHPRGEHPRSDCHEISQDEWEAYQVHES